MIARVESKDLCNDLMYSLRAFQELFQGSSPSFLAVDPIVYAQLRVLTSSSLYPLGIERFGDVLKVLGVIVVECEWMVGWILLTRKQATALGLR